MKFLFILIIINILLIVPIQGFSLINCMNHVDKARDIYIQHDDINFINNNDTINKIKYHYEQALDLCPNLYKKYPQICNNLADIYFRQGDLDKAQYYCKKALSISPDMENALMNLSKIYEKKELFTLALDCYLKVFEKKTKNVEAKQLALNIYLNHSCDDKAVEKEELLMTDEVYNVIACTSVFKRAKKFFPKNNRAIIVTSRPLILRNILFDTGRAEIKQESFPQLDNIVDMMKQQRDLKLRIDGHTDNDPVNGRLEVIDGFYCSSNQCLSEYRAVSVKNYLIQKGIHDNRFRTKGYASTRPCDSINKAKNRRVEIQDLKYADDNN